MRAEEKRRGSEMMTKQWPVIVGIMLLLAPGSTAPAAAKNQNDVRKKTTGDMIREVLPESQPVFTERDRLLITGWYHDRSEGLPPGLAKRGTLPPGLAKHLQERGTLPPGLQKKIEPLPPDLERQLSRLPTGYRRVIVAGNAILMNDPTALIYDIVRNVIP
jgi:hypothetical protein